MRTTSLLVAGLAVSLALVTAMPSVSANHPECGASTNLIVVWYECTVHGAGATGDVQWCPDNRCASTVYCYVDVDAQTYGCTL